MLKICCNENKWPLGHSNHIAKQQARIIAKLNVPCFRLQELGLPTTVFKNNMLIRKIEWSSLNFYFDRIVNATNKSKKSNEHVKKNR